MGLYNDNLVNGLPQEYGSVTYTNKNNITGYNMNVYMHFDALSVMNTQKKTWDIE